MKLKLSEFSKLYKTSKKYWYIIPRAQYFNQENLRQLHTVLTFCKQLQYIKVKDLPQKELFIKLDPEDSVLREWDTRTQAIVQRQMIEEGIIKPTAKKKQTLADHLANFRNHSNLFQKLGFAYFNKLHHLFISNSGERFLSAEEHEWDMLLEEQMLKLQFYNPSLDVESDTLHEYKEFNIFPYLFTITLMLSLRRKYLDPKEFTLFVTPMKNSSELEKTKELIENFRKLPEEKRDKIIKYAALTTPHQINSVVIMGLFGCTPTFIFEEGKLKFRDIARGKLLVEQIYPKLKFIDYKSFEDWFKYMGDTEFEIPNIDIMEYYVDQGDSKRAKEVIRFTDDIKEQESLSNILDKLFKERLLEDALEKKPHVLESGLKLFKNGRQYRTDVSTIDLLMRDREQSYVVVELKKGKTEDGVVGQTLRYMGWVRENMSKAQPVRGIIVVAKGEITLKLKMAIIGLQHCQDLIQLKEIPIHIGDLKDHN